MGIDFSNVTEEGLSNRRGVCVVLLKYILAALPSAQHGFGTSVTVEVYIKRVGDYIVEGVVARKSWDS